MTTVTTTDRTAGFSNGTAPIPFYFQALSEDEVGVYRNFIEQIGGYSVELNGDGTGSVTPDSDWGVQQVIIFSKPSFQQTADFARLGAFYPDQLNAIADRAMRTAIALKGHSDDVESRTVRLPQGETMYPLVPAAGRVGRFFGFDPLSGAPVLMTDQEIANRIADLLTFSYTGIPGPGNDLATHYEAPSGGNDTTAINAALLVAQANTGTLKLGEGDFDIDQLDIPPGVKLVGAGKGLTRLRQSSGLTAGTSAIRIYGSHTKVLDLTVVGNIATDTLEFNHAVECYVTLLTGSIEDVEIDIHAQDIRGDAVLIGVAPTAYAANLSLKNVHVRSVTGDNIYRNGFSIVGGSNIRIDYWNFTRVGLYDWDIETDVGSGPVIDVWIEGGSPAFISCGGTTANDYLSGIHLGTQRCNPANTARSVPAYPLALDAAFSHRNVKSMTIDDFYAEDYVDAAFMLVGGHALDSSVIDIIGEFSVINCQIGGGSTAWITNGAGVELNAGSFYAETTASGQYVFTSSAGFTARSVQLNLATGSTGFNDCEDFIFTQSDMEIADGGAGGTFAINCRGLSTRKGDIVGGSFLGYGCTNCVLENVEVTCTDYVTHATSVTLLNVKLAGTDYALLYYASGGSSPTVQISGTGVITAPEVHASLTGYLSDVGGNQVVGQRGAAIANAVGSAGPSPVGSEFNQHADRINAILALLRTWGAITT